jgi:hypothetical protein
MNNTFPVNNTIRKQISKCIPSVTSLIIISILLMLPASVLSDTAEYLYDDVGRLVRVINGNERALYRYDEVGNLLGIGQENSVTQASPPVIQNLNPDIFIIGSTHYVTISGQNLLSTSSVTSNDPNITIKNVIAIDTQIQAVFTISGNASPGQATITVTTSYGSANTGINMYSVNLLPEALSVFPTGTASMSASLTPAASRDYHIAVINKNSNIINVPAFINIPSGGNGSITVKGLREGTGVIQMGNAESTIFVVNNELYAKPVSVSIGAIPGDTTAAASPVSVAIGTVNSYLATSSKNVSVAWPFSVSSLPSIPVSVGW